MESKLKLNQGETIKLVNHRSKGSLAETDIYMYLVVDQSGEEVGTVEHTDHTSINGLKRSQTVVQKDMSGNVLVSDSW